MFATNAAPNTAEQSHTNILVHNVSHADFILSVNPGAGEGAGGTAGAHRTSTPFIKPKFSCFHETALAVEGHLNAMSSKDTVVMCPVAEVPELEFPIGFSLGGV